jgi:hypothetical protein
MTWKCLCGASNTGHYCGQCGQRYAIGSEAQQIRYSRPGSEIGVKWLVAAAVLVAFGCLGIYFALFGESSRSAPFTPPASTAVPAPAAEVTMPPPHFDPTPAKPEVKETPSQPQPMPAKPVLGPEKIEELKRRRDIDLEIIQAGDAMVAAKSRDEAITVYCRFVMKGLEDFSSTPPRNESYKQWMAEENVNACRSRILTGADQMLSAERINGYVTKAQSELDSINEQLAPDVALATAPGDNAVAKTQVNAPTSGVLCNSNTVQVRQNEELVFKDLPASRLKFTFDHDVWTPIIHRQANGLQTLVMRSIQPGTQTECNIRWEIIP